MDPAGRRRDGGTAGSEAAVGSPAFAFPVGAGGPRPQTTNERPAARLAPLRLRNMKDTTNMNMADQAGDDQPDEPLAAYTPQQRRTIVKGLRILARVAIRSYLRQQAKQAQAGTEPLREDEG